METYSPSMLFCLFIFLGICYLLQGINTKKISIKKESKKKVIVKKKASKKAIIKENPLYDFDETIFLPPPVEHRMEEIDLFPLDGDLDLWGKDFSVNGKE